MAKLIFFAALAVALARGQAPVRLDPPARVAPTTAPHELDADDVNAWLDGLLPYALKSGEIAGAVVVVVKDGRTLTQRGFGFADVAMARPVDPEHTLFRPGSISKLFTWTAVMQLVESGRLDLDRDIDAYLDFHIPSTFGVPITMRHLMTHTAGFEETYKGLVVRAPENPLPLGRALKTWVPSRIFAPGAVPAYSNYGAALAGDIVERVSGEPFAEYIDRHILQPLRMMHSSFQQPLPPSLAADMSRGYDLASNPPRPYEIVNLTPAGALASTGADMGRFMLAHLEDGSLDEVRILQPATAKWMHATAFTAIPSMPGMALGFYHEDRNGRNIIGHRGNSAQFHSDLHLFLGQGVGLYISMNGSGNESANQLRDQLLDEFTDRYFPAPPVAPEPVLASARAHGASIAGRYLSSRRSRDTILAVANLFNQQEVTSDADGTIATSRDHVTTHWREVAPYLWRAVNGRARLGAIVRDNRVVAFQTDDRPPAAIFQRVPAWLDAGWNIPLLVFTLIVIVITALGWPVAAVLRRIYGLPLGLNGVRVRLYHLARLAAVADFLFCAGWAIILGVITADVTAMSSRLDPWIRLVQIFGLIGVVGSLAALAHAVMVARDRGARFWSKCSAGFTALACVAFVWFAFLLHLLTPGLNY